MSFSHLSGDDPAASEALLASAERSTAEPAEEGRPMTSPRQEEDVFQVTLAGSDNVLVFSDVPANIDDEEALQLVQFLNLQKLGFLRYPDKYSELQKILGLITEDRPVPKKYEGDFDEDGCAVDPALGLRKTHCGPSGSLQKWPGDDSHAGGNGDMPNTPLQGSPRRVRERACL